MALSTSGQSRRHKRLSKSASWRASQARNQSRCDSLQDAIMSSWRLVLKNPLPILAGAAALMLSACATTDTAGSDGSTGHAVAYQLEGSTFKILSVNGTPVLKDHDADLRFQDGRISGTAGCNRINGAFTQRGNVLGTSGVAMTMMACPPANMAQEREALAVLENGATVTRQSDGRVIIRGPKGGILELHRSF